MTDAINTTEAATQAPAEVAPAPLNEYVNMSKQLFHFKTDKVKDDKGVVIGAGKKHPSVGIFLPVPKLTRLQEFLANPETYAKEIDLLLGAVTSMVYSVARGQINEFREANKDAVVTPQVLNYDQLDFTAIANMPKSERGSSVPSDEDIKAFLESYQSVMPGATERTADKIAKHVEIIATGFKKQRAQKDMLEFFVQMFAVYAASVDEATLEEHQEVFEYFGAKLERMLKVEEKVTMDDL